VSFDAGMRVGPYELVSAVAHGGMGQVWRARDSRLGRDVAIKVLPDAFDTDRERLVRFERECQVLASLSHPHIAIVHGLEDTPAGRALVMEFIAGPTLAERLARGPLPILEAVAVARDIASALEAAHERGIVHRDLKPSNLKFSDAGEVKVLDFGLAKIESVATGTSAADTGTAPPADTGPGTILGTAAYMSPEQARGAPVDRRTDIWAFGCVLYEMVSGRQAFSGATITDLLAAVIGGEPAWSALPPNTPAALRALMARCLRKDARQRLRDIGDARIALDEVLANREPDVAVSPTRPGTLARRLAWSAAIAALVVASAWGIVRRHPDTPHGPLRKLEFSVREPLTTVFTRPRIAPDGSAVVYGGAGRLWVRRLDELEAREVPGSVGAEAPFWSWDSHNLAFARARTLWRVAAEGGEPVPVCDLPATGRIISGAWRDDDSIVFAAWQQSLYEVPARGGDPRVLLATDPAREVDFHELCPVPGSRALLFVRHDRIGEQQHIELLSPEGRRTIVLQARDNARYDNPRIALSGYLVYERIDSNQGVWAVPFSLSTLSVTGEPFRVAPGATSPSVAQDGTLIYTADSTRYQLAWVDRAGRPAGLLGEPLIELQMPALSPDGTRVVAAAADETNVYDRDLWTFDVSSGRHSRIQPRPTPTRDVSAAWLPGGTQVIYVQFRRDPATLVVATLDDRQPPQDITPVSGGAAVSPDGRVLVVPRTDASGRSSLWRVVTTGAQPPDAARLGFDHENAVSPRLSPDGRLLAYVSDDSGQQEVYLRLFPGPGSRAKVSVDGGSSPDWSRQGAELCFRSGGGQFVASRIALENGAIRAAAPAPLFTEAASGALLDRGWAAAADGRLLVVRRAEASHTGRITVVQHWAEEFRR